MRADLASIAGLQVLKQATSYWAWAESRGVGSEGAVEAIDGGLSFFGLRYLEKYLLGEGSQYKICAESVCEDRKEGKNSRTTLLDISKLLDRSNLKTSAKEDAGRI